MPCNSFFSMLGFTNSRQASNFISATATWRSSGNQIRICWRRFTFISEQISVPPPPAGESYGFAVARYGVIGTKRKREMEGLVVRAPFVSTAKKLPFSPLLDSLPSCSASGNVFAKNVSTSLKRRGVTRLTGRYGKIRANSSNVSIGSDGYKHEEEKEGHHVIPTSSPVDSSSKIEKSPNELPYPLSIALVLIGCSLVFSLIAFVKGGPSSILAAVAKSGFTAAFSLIFVSEIGDKTFFIAALLAMQYKKGLVLLGSMGALSLMTVLSVIIGRIFHSVPAQFQTTLPIGEYAAVTLLLFFGLKSIKDAWDIPSSVPKQGDESPPELDEYVEAEELVKEKVSKRLSNPLEIIWKSFSLIFFAEWGDRSMLATIALGAAQSPWGVATGAITGHLIATTIAILGGAFLANYISEKLVGYVGGILFLIFAVATFFGVF